MKELNSSSGRGLFGGRVAWFRQLGWKEVVFALVISGFTLTLFQFQSWNIIVHKVEINIGCGDKVTESSK